MAANGRMVLIPVSYEEGIYHLVDIYGGNVVSVDSLSVSPPFSNPGGNYVMLRQRLEGHNHELVADTDRIGTFISPLSTSNPNEMPEQALACARKFAHLIAAKKGGVRVYLLEDKTLGLGKGEGRGIEKSAGDK